MIVLPKKDVKEIALPMDLILKKEIPSFTGANMSLFIAYSEMG